MHPSLQEAQVQLLTPVKCLTLAVTQSAGSVSNCINIVVKAGSITKGTKNKKAKRLNIASRTNDAVV